MLQQELDALQTRGEASSASGKIVKVPRLKLQKRLRQNLEATIPDDVQAETSPRSDVSFGGHELFSGSSRGSSPLDSSERGSDRTPKAALEE